MRAASIIFSVFLTMMGTVTASHRYSSEVEVLVNGAPVPRYFHNGITYVEAIKGKQYEIRITNPIGSRVAVALAVDGLNTIDARHTDARSGRKWVLGPYESIVISGWQTNAQQARRFFFTTEDRSYGARLGKTENLGIISAVFFREKNCWAERPIPVRPAVPMPRLEGLNSAPGEKARKDASGSAGAPSEPREMAASSAADTDYAATGIGDRIEHQVEWIHMDLEEHPFVTTQLRYEFRPVLVRLGVIPPLRAADPLTRREHARGFRDTGYCPEP